MEDPLLSPLISQSVSFGYLMIAPAKRPFAPVIIYKRFIIRPPPIKIKARLFIRFPKVVNEILKNPSRRETPGGVGMSFCFLRWVSFYRFKLSTHSLILVSSKPVNIFAAAQFGVPLQISFRRFSVSAIGLPRDVAKGMMVLPEKS